jgi:hypothetical protein
MQRVHREVVGGRRIDINHFIKHSLASASSSDRNVNVPFVDLDFSSADPSMRWQQQRGGRPDNASSANASSGSANGAATNASAAVTSDDYDYNFPAASRSLIPPNMRIAGRVTGTGRFQKTAEDELMQAAADLAQNDRWVFQLNSGSIREGEFPTLAEVAGRGGDSTADGDLPASSKQADIQALLSTVGRNKTADRPSTMDPLVSEILARRSARCSILIEMLNSVRNSLDDATQLLMDCFNKDGSLGQGNELSKLLEIYQRPLYSPDLILWARKNRVELFKIEKK